MHRRQEVRDALVAAMVAAIPDFEGRVFPMRTRTMGEDETPGARVFTTADARDPEAGTLSQDMHRITTRIEIVVKASDDAERQLDDLAEQLEQLLLADPMLGGAVTWIRYQSTEIDYDEDDETVMQAALTYDAEYRS